MADVLILEVKLKDQQDNLVLRVRRHVTLGSAVKAAQEEADNFVKHFKDRKAKHSADE